MQSVSSTSSLKIDLSTSRLCCQDRLLLLLLLFLSRRKNYQSSADCVRMIQNFDEFSSKYTHFSCSQVRFTDLF